MSAQTIVNSDIKDVSIAYPVEHTNGQIRATAIDYVKQTHPAWAREHRNEVIEAEVLERDLPTIDPRYQLARVRVYVDEERCLTHECAHCGEEWNA